MTKRVYELAAELGIRSERLVQLLQQEGFRVESVLDQLDSQAAMEIRQELEASRSRWSRLKTLLGRRMGKSRLPSAAALGEEEEGELEELVSQQEDREQPVPVALELDEVSEDEQQREPADARLAGPPRVVLEQEVGEPQLDGVEPQPIAEAIQPSEETPVPEAAEPTVGETPAEAVVGEGPVEERREPVQVFQDASVEGMASTSIPLPPEGEPIEPPGESLPGEGESPAGREQETRDEDSLLETLDRIAQMEEANGRSLEEPLSADALLEGQLGALDASKAQQPIAAATPTGEEKAEGKPLRPEPVEGSESVSPLEEEPVEVAEVRGAEQELVPQQAPQGAEESPEILAESVRDSAVEPSPAEEGLAPTGFGVGETVSVGRAPSGDAPLSADELPERQLAAVDAQGEQKQPGEPVPVAEDTLKEGASEAAPEQTGVEPALQAPLEAEPSAQPPPAEVSETPEVAPAPAADLEPEPLAEEERVAAGAGQEREAPQPPVFAPEPGKGEPETGAGPGPLEQQESKTVTIDELLGTAAQEGQPTASEIAAPQPEAIAPADEDELLDTQSLLGLEFSEQAEAQPPSESGSVPDEQAREGVKVEELLGVSEVKQQRVAHKLSPLTRRLQHLMGEIGAAVRNPGSFLKSLSNLELVIVSLALLLTLSGAFYAFYRWYNFNRPGMDKRFFQWAERLRKAGRYEGAIDKYQMVLKYHPGSDRVKPSCFGLADARYRSGQFREAIPTYERALTLYEHSGSQGLSVEGFPDFLVVPRARLNLARSMLHVGFYERAKEELVELASQFPGEEIGEESRLLLGDLYMQWAREENRPEKYRNAVSEYHLALNEYPGTQRQVELMTYLGDSYRALYEAQLEDEKDRQLLQEASAQYEKAARMALEEQRPQEEVARIRVAWADTQRELGATRSAIEAYDRLLGTGLPMDLQVEVLEKIARSYLALEDFALAERWAQELVEHNPDDSGLALAYYVFGDAEWERKRNRDYTRMMQAYQKALQLDEQSGPDAAHSQRAYMRMTYVLYRMNNDYEEAAEKYRTIIEKYPDGPYTYRAKFFLAECLQSLGHHVEAADAYGCVIDDYATTVHVSPTYYRDALYRRGDCLLAGGRSAEAVRAYQTVLKELGFPETPEAIAVRKQLADAYIALRDYPQAEKVLMNLRGKFPQADRDGGVSLNLAGVRESLFDYEGARQVYLELTRDGRDPTAIQAAFSRLGASYLAQLPGVEPREEYALRLAAVSTYEAMQRRFPKAQEADLASSRLYHDLGDLRRAASHLEGFLKRASADDPQVEAAVLLGEIAWEEGRTDEAVEHFQLVEQLPAVPGDQAWRAQGHYRLAECFRQRRELAEARAEYEKVLVEFPDSPWAKEADWKLNNVDWQLQLSQLEAAASL